MQEGWVWVMDYKIREMKNLTLADNGIWGNKAAYLSDARENGIPVPDGFCIAIKGKGIDKNNSQFLKELEGHFNQLKENTHSTFYIARSSSQYEDRENHIFPGIYKSRKNIADINRLVEDVELCCKSFSAKIVDRYIKEAEVKEPQQQYSCVIVQEQIEPEYSGVAFTKVPIEGYHGLDSFLVEMTRGHCQDMLQGKRRANTYIVRKQPSLPEIKKLFCPDGIDGRMEYDILEKLAATVNRIVELYGTALNIEWGYTKGRIIIFQIRPMAYRNRKTRWEDKEEVLDPIENGSRTGGGLKAEAMRKFYEAGLFQKELLIIEPGKALDDVLHILEMENSLKGEITVRYSCGRELGLPRYFAENKKAALQFISDTYETEWAVILHESISVRNSYELYLDENKAILEHVPGMWETDSKSAADTWIFRGHQVEAYAANCLRKARYENASAKEYHMIEPYTEKEIREIAVEIFPYIEKVKKYWPVVERGGFHFVRDIEGRIFFLNHRKISEIPEWEENYKELTVIENEEDFSKWKGGDILLKLSLKRGEEVLLREYIPALKRMGAKVYVQFGILSHPAILLREMGIEICPEYTLHRRCSFMIP